MIDMSYTIYRVCVYLRPFILMKTILYQEFMKQEFTVEFTVSEFTYSIVLTKNK